MIENNRNKRAWLARMTAFVALSLLFSFLFILVRGVVWSPHEIDDNTLTLELGATTMLRESGQRLWVTRLNEQQRNQLAAMVQFVFTDGGCSAEQRFCRINSATAQQGIMIVYVDKKPDTLSAEATWLGSFINPTNGAVYDLLGRLYRTHDHQADTVDRFINVAIQSL